MDEDIAWDRTKMAVLNLSTIMKQEQAHQNGLETQMTETIAVQQFVYPDKLSFQVFFRECTLIFMIERKRPGHSDNVGLSEEDSSSFDHQIRWVLSNIRYILGLCHWKIRA